VSPAKARTSAAAAAEEALNQVVSSQRVELQHMRGALTEAEAERDFFYQKLRSMEILCEMLQSKRPLGLTADDVIADVQKILFAQDGDPERCDEDEAPLDNCSEMDYGDSLEVVSTFEGFVAEN